MHNRANRTEGLLDWNTINWESVNRHVRNLRQRIFRATQEGDWDKVQSLQRLMLRSTSNAAQSVRRVTQDNQGKNTPGIDKLLVKTPSERSKLLNDITNHTAWRAQPVKRVYIPKANGKLRPLGIPVIKDRALQAIVKNALEPSWEARFEATSYGFRPGRSGHDAMERVWNICNKLVKVWIVDADIQGCFDNINHQHLLQAIGVFPAKELIRQWLKAGYVEYGKIHETLTGTPQGGVISPLLANISLHGMEQALGLRYRKNGWSVTANRCAVVRYADDFVILCNTEQEAQKAQETISIWLAERGLQLSTEKTRIVHLKSGFDFLGFNVRMVATRKKRNGWALHITPSKRSVSKIKKRLHDEMTALQGHNVAAVIGKLNPIIRGWANYFKTQMSSATFRNLEHYMYQLERRYVDRMHPNKPIYFKRAKYFGKLNPFRNDYSVFGDKATGKYLEKFSWIHIVRHSLVKGTYSPDDPALNWYWDKRTLRKARDLRPILRTLALRQKGKCPLCGDSLFNEENIEKHHILRRNEGGGNTLDNLVLLHLYCHQQITAAQLKAIQSWRPKKIETIV